ncbi:hypothetical protein C1N73_32720 (plasmid) [Priestia aryabhattai]
MLLVMIKKKEGAPFKELREDTLVTKQNISSMVERLPQSGYVETYEDLSNPRITCVNLTEQGKETLQFLTPMTNAYNDEIFEIFEPEDIFSHASFLERLVSHLK